MSEALITRRGGGISSDEMNWDWKLLAGGSASLGSSTFNKQIVTPKKLTEYRQIKVILSADYSTYKSKAGSNFAEGRRLALKSADGSTSVLVASQYIMGLVDGGTYSGTISKTWFLTFNTPHAETTTHLQTTSSDLTVLSSIEQFDASDFIVETTLKDETISSAGVTVTAGTFNWEIYGIE